MTAAAQGRASAPRASIRTIWGLAKSPELSLDESALYAIVERETGKEHMRELSQGDIDRVCRVLCQMKDDTKRSAPPAKRTDEGGNPKTISLRRKIYMLTGELGWNGQPKRLDGFIRRMFKVDRLEWLTVPQCHKLIEALKKMVEREKGANHEQN